MTILTLLWRFTIGGAWKWLAAGVGLVGLYLKGRADSKAKQAGKDAKAFQKTTERMQDADAAMGDDPAVLRDRLRNRDPKQR
mgnify:CR=1